MYSFYLKTIGTVTKATSKYPTCSGDVVTKRKNSDRSIKWNRIAVGHHLTNIIIIIMSHIVRKPVFGVSD